MKLTYLLLIATWFVSITSIAQPIVVGGNSEDTLNQPVSIGSVHIDYKNPQEYTLGPIRVEGAENYDPNAIKLIAGLREGQKIRIPGQQVANAINNLWKENLFSSVDIYAEKEVAGVMYLVIKVAPRNKLSKFRFEGITRREADKIREEIDLFSGKTISENLVYQTENQIKGHFREKGYYSVQVNITRQPDKVLRNSEVFVINVNKGKRVKINDILITGNESVPTWKLKMAMKDTKEKAFWRFFKRSKFTTTAYERDQEAMLGKFGKIGLRDAVVSIDSVYLVDDKNLNIAMHIDEGEKYYFGDITWVGNSKFRSTFLDTILGIKKGDIYNKQLLEQRLFMSQDNRDISSLYMDRGYLFFQVIPVEKNVADNYINYEMRIIEGKEARVRDIIISGNTKTNEYVIRREIRTRPGDLFNRNDIMRTQRELAQLGYFNEQAFQVNPMPNPQDGTVDIEYVVEEKSSDQIELSGGYGGAGANNRPMIIGTLGLTFNNFSVKNMFKFGQGYWSPLPAGDGQRLSIRAQTTGRFYRALSFSFTEPWLGGKKPNSLSIFASSVTIGNGELKRSPDFEGANIASIGAAFGRRRKYPDDYFTEQYELQYQKYFVNNYQAFSLFPSGTAHDISFQYTIQRSSVSSPIYPQSGSNIKLSAKTTAPYSLFDGVDDYSDLSSIDRYKLLEYYKVKFSGEWYFPLTSDKKLVLRTRVGFGFMGAYNQSKGVTPFDRFYLGGSGLTGVNQLGGREVIALRGYDDLELSSQSGDPLAVKYTTELRYPISLNPSATFFVMAFAEAGNSFPTFKTFNPMNVKRSVGVGLRAFLPMFGMLGLDYGWGFDSYDPWAVGYGGARHNTVLNQGYMGKFTFTIGMNLGDL